MTSWNAKIVLQRLTRSNVDAREAGRHCFVIQKFVLLHLTRERHPAIHPVPGVGASNYAARDWMSVSVFLLR